MHIVDYFVIAGYFALVMYLGYYSMKKVSNFDDYAVAGRSMPLPIFFAAIAATLCGGGATIGRISFMHTTGIIVFFALTGVVINQIFSGLFISTTPGKMSTASGTCMGFTMGVPVACFPVCSDSCSAWGRSGYRSWRWAPSSRPPRASASSPPR